MRHKNGFNKLGRKTAHREAMLSNMAGSLILHKRITTTLQKAKALRSFVEPIITLSKEDTMHHRRMAFKYLQSKEAVKELFREVSNKIADRPGGYTRILKTGMRAGDNADLCIIELVDYNMAMLESKEAKKATTGRTRRSRTKKSDEVIAEPKTKAPVKQAEAVVEDVPVAEEKPVTEQQETTETPEEQKPEGENAEK